MSNQFLRYQIHTWLIRHDSATIDIISQRPTLNYGSSGYFRRGAVF